LRCARLVLYPRLARRAACLITWPATRSFSPLSLHDALPISRLSRRHSTAYCHPRLAGFYRSTARPVWHERFAVRVDGLWLHARNNRTERSGLPDRSTRLRSGHGTRQRRRSGFVAAVELRLGKIRTGQAQNLVRFAQFPVLAFQSLDAFSFLGRLAGAVANISLVFAYPAMQRLGDTANLGRNGFDGCPFGGVVLQVLQNHAHSTFTDFRGIAIRFLHASFSQELRPPRTPVRFSSFFPSRHLNKMGKYSRPALVNYFSSAT